MSDDKAGVMGPVVTPELPDTSQEWARLDGMAAYHLIDRHGDDWAQIGRMMESWRIARTAYLATGGKPCRAEIRAGGKRDCDGV